MAGLNISLNLTGNFQQMMQGVNNRINNAISSMNRFNNVLHSGINQSSSSQQNFTNALGTSDQAANKLLGTIKKIGTAVASVEIGKLAMNTSDTLVSSTARLGMMNDGRQSTDDLWKMIYASAQDSRGDLNSMTSLVARLGNNAGDAFSSSAEIVKFAGLVQKQMTIGGASAEEAANATLQLSQALASGVLRGDELNSIFEQAPNLIKSIATYLNVPMGEIRSMAAEGKLSADIVKKAMFASEKDIEKQFNSMPVTFGQVWTMFKNSAQDAFRPVSNQMSKLVNSDKFKDGIDKATRAMASFFSIGLKAVTGVANAFGKLKAVGTNAVNYIKDNWVDISNTTARIAPVILGIGAAILFVKAATATATIAVGVYNAVCSGVAFIHALIAASNPFTIIVLSIAAVIVALGLLAGAFVEGETTLGVYGDASYSTFAKMVGGINIVKEGFVELGQSIANAFIGAYDGICTFADNSIAVLADFFTTAGEYSSSFFEGLSGALGVVAEDIGGEGNSVAEFFYGGADQWKDWKNNFSSAHDFASQQVAGGQSISDAFLNGATTYDTFVDGWQDKAFVSGASGAQDLENKLKKAYGKFKSNLTNGTNKKEELDKLDKLYNSSSDLNKAAGKTADNTDKINKNLSIASEDLKYLRDISERDVINRFTTAEIKVSMKNNNTVSSNMDLDGITEHLRRKVEEQMYAAAKGVH